MSLDRKLPRFNILFFPYSLMEQIPLMFGETRETETVLGPVIQAGKEAFKVSFVIFMN